MNLKAMKTKTQDNIMSVMKTMVGENVNVQVVYDLEQEIVNVLLVEENKQEETVERIVVYSCTFSKENQALTVSGFARRYAYDAFGIAFVNNEPVIVDEPFIAGIKAGINAGLNMPLEDEPVKAEPESDSVAE
jgi:hypothetical protein